MAHLASIAFFSGLLIALGMVIELTVRAYWAEIVAACRGVPSERAPSAAGPRAEAESQLRAAA